MPGRLAGDVRSERLPGFGLPALRGRPGGQQGQVVVCTRTSWRAHNRQWQQAHPGVRLLPLTEAGTHGEVIVNASAGAHSLAALEAAGAINLAGKVLFDLTLPLDLSQGMPPTLLVANDDSLGEQIQRAYPEARVVKTLNTMGNEVMIHPEQIPGRHCVFMSGDNAEAKQLVAGMLESFGWPPDSIVDLGGIETARGTEMYLVLWIEIMQARGDRMFNIAIAAPGG